MSFAGCSARDEFQSVEQNSECKGQKSTTEETWENLNVSIRRSNLFNLKDTHSHTGHMKYNKIIQTAERSLFCCCCFNAVVTFIELTIWAVFFLHSFNVRYSLSGATYYAYSLTWNAINFYHLFLCVSICTRNHVMNKWMIARMICLLSLSLQPDNIQMIFFSFEIWTENHSKLLVFCRALAKAKAKNNP